MLQIILCAVLLVSIAQGEIDTQAGLTCATPAQVKEIAQLIKKIQFGQVENAQKSEYARYTGKKLTYRLDNEGPAKNGGSALFRIQLNGVRPSPTYTSVTIKLKTKYGKDAIQKVFNEGVAGCKKMSMD